MRAFFAADDEQAALLLADATAGYVLAQQWRRSLSYPLALVTPGVRNWVAQESGQMIVAQRLKRMPQIISKLRRFPTMRLSQMEDIAGCRAVLLDNGEVEAVGKRIERKWKVRYRSDYRQEGKPGTGYRGLHYVVIRRDRLVEIQLRTNRQHEWAEAVERTASRTGHDLKDGQGPPELVEYFRAASDVIWAQENGLAVDEGLMEDFMNLRERVRPFFRARPRRARRRPSKNG
jgi:ppGpp synthetase/RelA/SpoT-type nucleotidyltranferase